MLWYQSNAVEELVELNNSAELNFSSIQIYFHEMNYMLHAILIFEGIQATVFVVLPKSLNY